MAEKGFGFKLEPDALTTDEKTREPHAFCLHTVGI